MAYDPKKHVVKLKGGKEFLPAWQRVVWFREQRPDWSIETKVEVLDVDAGIAVFQATIRNEQGRIVAQATAMETRQGFPDWLEKAETSSIARALGLCGFGAEFTPDEDEQPERGRQAPPARASPPRSGNVSTPPATGEQKVICSATGCGEIINAETAQKEAEKGAPPLCIVHWGEWKQGKRDHVPAEIASRYPTAEELREGQLSLGGSD